jgi:TetR/AcrR family transcriptional regulator
VARPKNSARVDTRARILAAAVDEFASRGYDGAGVDRIARRARVNKALIYYYFESKRGLYHEILHDGMRRLAATLTAVVDADATAVDKLDRYVEALDGFLHDNAHVPPIMLRELAEGGRHLEAEALRTMTSIPGMLFRLITQGRAEHTFRDIDPLMLHFVLLGTSMLMASNEPIRRRIRQLGLADPPIDRQSTVAALTSLARQVARKDQRDVSTH